MHWAYLAIAIVLEICATTFMKLSRGFERPVYSILMFVFYAACFAVFSLALKKIDISVAYAIWSGVGTLAIATIGFALLGESVNLMKIVGILLIVVGVVILNLSGVSRET